MKNKSEKEGKKHNNMPHATIATNDTDATNVTNVTNVTQKACVTRNPEKSKYNFLFKIGYKHQILFLLFCSDEPLTYDQIAQNIGINENQIRPIITKRNSNLFKLTVKQGRKKCWELSDKGQTFVKNTIDVYEEKKNFEELKKQKEVQELKNLEDLQSETSKLFRTIKYKKIKNSIYLNFVEILEFNHFLADKLLDEPKLVLAIFQIILKEQLLIDRDYDIRITNLPESCNVPIENIRSKHIGKLIAVEARCVSMSSVRPQIINAKFECSSCGTLISVLQKESVFREPSRCSCGRKGGFKIVDKDLSNTSRIILEDLQEKTDNPHAQRINGIIRDDLTDKDNIKTFIPGNEIECIGILQEIAMQTRSQQVSTRLDYGFDIISAKLSEKEIEVGKFNEEEVREIKEVAGKINAIGLDEINTSFAPEIYGYNYIKNALILQLCNRRNKITKEEIKNIRNKPNILLIGDPGIAKSVLGDFVISITPKSRKAVGGGSSAVGITASVVKEEESMGGYRVEPGALVLAKDILFLDELNNLMDEDKPKLQEGMSEQCISINKANLHVKLKVTAGILASANPKDGHFNQGKSYVQQFNIPSPIMNRFDEIFIMKDDVDEDKDKKIAKKMIDRERGKIEPKYSKEFLRKFFSYIKNFKQPTIDDEISKKLESLYSKVRKYKTNEIIINPRFMESLTRLIRASAKIRLSEKVEEKDIEQAMEILSKSHYQINEYKNFDFKNGAKSFSEKIKPEEKLDSDERLKLYAEEQEKNEKEKQKNN